MFSIIGEVVIRTNGGNLTVDAEKDTVRHYGWVKDLKIEAVSDQDCYHEKKIRYQKRMNKSTILLGQ